MRLLLCTGHSVLGESLAWVLGEAGYEIVAVTCTPDEALTALGAAPADLCVLDVGDSPDAVLDQIAAIRAAAPAMAIVLLAGFADPDVVVRAAAHGVRGFAYKEQHVSDVIDTIERVHRGETVDPGLVRCAPPNATASELEARRISEHLTPREREVLCRLVNGDDTKGLARTMGVTWSTARSHIQSVLMKLEVHSRVEATAAAVRHGLVNAETGEWSLR